MCHNAGFIHSVLNAFMFGCNLSLEFRCGIFHLWPPVDVQNILDFGAFPTLDLGG